MVNLASELRTITSTMNELSRRITALVESVNPDLSTEAYSELVAAERTVGALQRRLERVGNQLELGLK